MGERTMSEQEGAATSGEADVDAAVGAAADRIKRALQSEDAGRVAGPGASPESRPQNTPAARDAAGEPPAADAAAP